MCGRYGFAPDGVDVYKRFGIKDRNMHFMDRYNVCPGENMPIVIGGDNLRFVMSRWGLLPSWAKNEDSGFKTINARAENLEEKPAFRESFLKLRCLVPSTGFFEWEDLSFGKRPYLIKIKKRKIFSFAGLFSIWRSHDGNPINAFSIVTVPANSVVSKVHDRMPAILEEEDEKFWTSTSTDTKKLRDLLKPAESRSTEMYEVSPIINSKKLDSPEVIKPYEGPVQTGIF